MLNAGRTAGKGIMDAATGDLLVIRTQSRLGRGKKARPVDMEFHVNPAALGVAAVGAGLTLWLMQMRVGAETVDVVYGHWVWPDGTIAINTEPTTVARFPPTRIRDDGVKEAAYWVYDRTERKSQLGLMQRQGFLGNGVGAAMDSVPWWIRMWSPITWIP